MELKDVTRETHLQECDFLSQRTKNECYWHDIRTIGQLLDTPDSKIEEWHGWKAKTEIREFFAKYNKYRNPYQVEVRVMFNRTFVKVLAELELGDVAIHEYTEFWYDAEDIKCVYKIRFLDAWHLVFDTKNTVPAKTYILKAYIDEKD